LLKDPAFKRFGAAVDRAVAAFDTIVEWTEYIVFLGRLQKVLPDSIPQRLMGTGAPGVSHISSDPVQTRCIKSARTLPQSVAPLWGSSTDSRSLHSHFLSNRGASLYLQLLTTSLLDLPKISKYGFLDCYLSSNMPLSSPRFNLASRLFPNSYLGPILDSFRGVYNSPGCFLSTCGKVCHSRPSSRTRRRTRRIF